MSSLTREFGPVAVSTCNSVDARIAEHAGSAVKATRKLYRSIRKDDLYGGPRGATPAGNDATKTPLKTIPEDRLAE